MEKMVGLRVMDVGGRTGGRQGGVATTKNVGSTVNGGPMLAVGQNGVAG